MEVQVDLKPRVTFEFEVEKVLGIAEDGRYQVQWAPAWVSKFHLVGCEHLVQEFLDKQQQQPQQQDSQQEQQQLLQQKQQQQQQQEQQQEKQQQQQPKKQQQQRQPQQQQQHFQQNQQPKQHQPQIGQQQNQKHGEQDRKEEEKLLNEDAEIVVVKIEDEQFEFHTDAFLKAHTVTEMVSNEKIDEDTTFGIVASSSNTNLSASSGHPQDELQLSATEEIHSTETRNENTETPYESEYSDYHSAEYPSFVVGQNLSNPPSDNLSPEEGGRHSDCDVNEYKCEICPKTYKKNCHLSLHMRSHRDQKGYGIKGYACDKCSFTTTQKAFLRAHMQVHKEKKATSCDVCMKSFTCPAGLKRHMQIHNDERPHTCEQCGKSFFRKFHLERHQVVHSGEKSYNCEICGKDFARQDTLNNHARSCARKSSQGVDPYDL